MVLRVVSFKILGNLGENSWSSVFEAGEDKLSLTRGKIWIIFSARLEDVSLDKISLSREFFSFFYNSYYQESAASNFHALKTTVVKTLAHYKEMFPDIELGAVSYAQKENVLNVAAVNGVWAGVIRNGFFSKILESKGDVIAASGYPHENDLFALGTKSSLPHFSSLDFSSFFVGGGVGARSLEQLKRYVLSGRDRYRSALFLMSFSAHRGLSQPIDLSESNAGAKNRSKGNYLDNIRLPVRHPFLESKLTLLLKNVGRKFVKKGGRKQRIFIRSTFRSLEEKEGEKRRVVLPLLTTVFILALSLIGRAWRVKKEKVDFLSSKFNEAVQKVEDAEKISSADYQSSRELLWSAKETLLFLEKEKYKDRKVAELRERIKGQEERVLREFSVSPEVFVDLTLLAPDFKADNIISDGLSIVVFDKVGRRVIKIAFDTKKTEAVSGPSNFEDLQDVALYAGKVFVLTKKGFFSVEDNSKMLFRNDFGNDALVFYYAGNVYVLDKDASRIYRINASGENFALPQIWTAQGIDVEMSGIRGWFIDGFIWVLYDDGRILRFSRGVPERVILKDVFPRLEKIQAVYSNEVAEFLYVLDNVLGRVVVFDKSGSYFAQYFSEELKGAKSIVVSEKEKRLVFSKEGGRLYLVSLKHLE